MTNFEYMKKQVLDAISILDEIEMARLIIDPCMNETGAEGIFWGIFCCELCEKTYGDCATWLDSRDCQDKYLNWCSMEHASNSNKKAVEETRRVLEDKKDIVKQLSILLKATRIGSDISKLILSKNEKIVTIKYTSASEKYVNVECDSGYALILDVLKALQ